MEIFFTQNELPRLPEQIRVALTAERKETFAYFGSYCLFCFELYPALSPHSLRDRLTVYVDEKCIAVLCPSPAVGQGLRPQMQTDTCSSLLFALMRGERTFLEQLEAEITQTEDDAISRPDLRSFSRIIIRYRKELLRRKRFYEELSVILNGLTDEACALLNADELELLNILKRRCTALCDTVVLLRDYVTQMREACQAQIDIEQNRLMKTFTVLTAVFQPLSLLTGWYGMNFDTMPELSWRFGYLAVIAASTLLVLSLLWYFHKKRWL